MGAAGQRAAGGPTADDPVGARRGDRGPLPDRGRPGGARGNVPGRSRDVRACSDGETADPTGEGRFDYRSWKSRSAARRAYRHSMPATDTHDVFCSSAGHWSYATASPRVARAGAATGKSAAGRRRCCGPPRLSAPQRIPPRCPQPFRQGRARPRPRSCAWPSARTGRPSNAGPTCARSAAATTSVLRPRMASRSTSRVFSKWASPAGSACPATKCANEPHSTGTTSRGRPPAARRAVVQPDRGQLDRVFVLVVQLLARTRLPRQARGLARPRRRGRWAGRRTASRSSGGSA